MSTLPASPVPPPLVSRTRPATAIRLAWGCALILWPAAILRAVGHAEAGRSARVLLRVLGARHIVQAIAIWWRADWAGLGIAADALHATTDLGLAAGSPRWRRAAFADALVALGFAAALNGHAVVQSSPPADADTLTFDQRALI